jgi:hypothetical protein
MKAKGELPMNKIPTNIMQCYVLHFIFRSVQTIANVMETKLAVVDKKLPSWVEKPVQDMLDDIFLDLGHSLVPVMYLAKAEYSGRPDRLKLLAFIEDKLRKSEERVDLKCHCAGCVEYQKIVKNRNPDMIYVRRNGLKKTGRPRKLPTKPIQQLEQEATEKLEKKAKKNRFVGGNY